MSTIERNLFGFWPGIQGDLDTAANATFTPGSVLLSKTGAAAARVGKTFTAAIDANVPGQFAKVVARGYISFAAYPSAGPVSLAGAAFALTSPLTSGAYLDTTGHVAAGIANTDVGAFSSAVLAINTTYELTISVLVTNSISGSAADDRIDVSVSVYTAAGVLVTTQTYALTSISVFSMSDWRVGPDANPSATFSLTASHWVYLAEGQIGATTITLPTSKLIRRAILTGPGASAAWSGVYTSLLDSPFDPANVNEMTVSAAADATFTHTLASIIPSPIEALKLYALVKSADGSTHALLLNGTEYAVAFPTSYAVKTALDWAAYSRVQFNAAEIGMRHKTGTALTSVNAMVLEILGGRMEAAPIVSDDACTIAASRAAREYLMPDIYTSYEEAIANGLAKLTLDAWPSVEVGYTCRDPLSRRGATVTVDLDVGSVEDPIIVSDTFKIQDVGIVVQPDGGDILPEYHARASNRTRTFDDALRKALTGQL